MKQENFLSRPGFLPLMGATVLTMELAVGRAGYSIYAKHLENCGVYAAEDLHTDCIINSDVDTFEAGKVIGAKAFIDNTFDKKTMLAALDRVEQG